MNIFMWNSMTYLLALLSACAWKIVYGGNLNYVLHSKYEHPSYYHYPAPQKHQFEESTQSQYYQQPHDQQYYQHSSQQTYHHHHQHQQYTQPIYYTMNASPATSITKQFTSPTLENAAFTMALTHQGYDVVNSPSLPVSTISTGRSLSSDLTSVKNLMIGLTHPHSQNVKLPVPLGVTPVRFTPLPLQAGAPYATVRGLTSYGTTYPQRKRRKIK